MKLILQLLTVLFVNKNHKFNCFNQLILSLTQANLSFSSVLYLLLLVYYLL